MNKKLLAVALMLMFGLFAAIGRADTISISFTNPTLSGAPGDVLTFSGTMTNLTNNTVFLNSGTVNIVSPFDASTDVTITLGSWPISLDPLAASTQFDFFTVTIPTSFSGAFGSYGGTLLAQGGVDPDAQDVLNLPTSASFSVDVVAPAATTVPEPGTVVLMTLGTAMMIAAGYRGLTRAA